MNPLHTYLSESTSESQAYARIRKIIGYTGIAIPLLCLSLAITNECSLKILPSISHYYYSVIGDAFVGVMFSLGMFLMAYRSVFKDKKLQNWENRLTNLAGLFAWIVALIPTNPKGGDCFYITFANSSYEDRVGFLGNFHLPAAGLMILIFGIISFNYFPRNWQTGKLDSENKKIYRRCAWIIFGSIFLLIVYFIDDKFNSGNATKFLGATPIVFILECTAIISFAISWLTKGRAAGAIVEMYSSMKKS